MALGWKTPRLIGLPAKRLLVRSRLQKHRLSLLARSLREILGHAGLSSQGTLQYPSGTSKMNTDTGLDEADNDEGHEGPLLSQAVSSALSGATSKFLTELLASMAELHRPAPRLSNRIRPYDWETVLNVVTNNGLIDNRKAQHIRRRMATVVGTAPDLVPFPALHPPVVSRALRQLHASKEDSLFVLEGFIPPQPPRSLKRSHRRKVATPVRDDLSPSTSPKRRKSSAGE